ncbi:NAD-dependent DNA ligase [Spiroplasma corruscae]|uniref:DNA ligase n=1 Tax=Spiroplasma corruscae TaxID=216934 RepID=A0A222ENA1_9MOLU|nr:NAD-dependent DNA ligase LigA [Spiroplasma corruscae]ASP27881.1 NAD-dependent DNA ligase [Spiroplasma corruscae]
MKDIKKVIEKLKKEINILEHAYYVLDNPLVDDTEFDAKLNLLKKLEKENPDLVTNDSPTQRVGGLISEKFEKHIHKFPMLSLDNAFDKEDLLEFSSNINKQVKFNSHSFFVEPKIDGLSISLIYEKGKLVKGVTRGDGIQGEDVTFNVRTIRSIPLTITDNSDYFEVRGEVFLSKKEFHRINAERKEQGEEIFANPRNAAAGTLRQLNPRIVASRKLDIYLYYYLNRERFETHSDSLDYINSLGFKVNKLGKQCSNIDEVYSHIELIKDKRIALDYEIDGAVVKVNDFKLYDEIGYTSKFPKWAIAYKYPAEIKSTVLKEIFATVGRTGKITYNAILEPVSLAGTTVQAATLHNAEYIYQKKIKVGANVKVKKAGDIIPEVVEVVEDESYPDLKEWIKVDNCPACGSYLEIFSDEVDQYCINFNCERKIIKSIEHFVSRDAMNIEGMSIKIIEKLYDNKIIKNVIDLYHLENKKKEILQLEKMGEKLLSNLLLAIEKSKTNDANRFLFGLGIRYVGSKTSKLLLENFKSIDNLLKANKEEIEKIFDVGPKVAQSIIDWISIESNIMLVNSFKKLGLNMSYSKHSNHNNSPIAGKSFVITGTLSKPRNYFVELIESNGGKVLNSISKSTNFLLAGDEAGSKLTKAKNLNINIINEEVFLNILEEE